MNRYQRRCSGAQSVLIANSRTPAAYSTSYHVPVILKQPRSQLITQCSAQVLEPQATHEQWTGLAAAEEEVRPGVYQGFVGWNGHQIRYQRSGDSGPAVILIHGFGGNCDHWRQNLPYLGRTCRVVALDLLGYGYSSKPNPRDYPRNSLFSFDTWSDQILDLSARFFGAVARPILISNSIGGIAVLEAALKAPDRVAAVQIQNISLRKLHVDNQPALLRPAIRAFQDLLRDTSVGKSFFDNVARPDTVRKVLQQAYHNNDTVTDELVDAILRPGLEPGAVDVFLDFISYSGGPLPARQLDAVTVPVGMLWGQQDPWEKVEWGRELAKCAGVVEYRELPGLGHCPHDEGPDVVNPLMEGFVMKHAQ